MSLLLEALKKAERAKEEALRRARTEGERTEPRMDSAETPAPAARPVMTRAELPDIKQPLEILSDDITAKQAPPAVDTSRPAAHPRPQGEPARQAEAQAADRATGKKVFESKFREPNPRLPFFITMGFLGVFTLGTVGYFWYQLRPPPSLVSANPKPPSGGGAPSVSGTAPGPAAAFGVPAGPTAIPGLPGAPVVAAAPPSTPAGPTAAQPPPAPAATPAPSPESKPAPRGIAPAPSAPRQIERAPVQARAPQVHPRVDAGYAAYLAGSLAAARTEYQEALRDDDTNRDALLGLAAVDVRTGRHEAAEATYLRLLQIDPNDAHAQAGLIALRSGRLDPLATESRVKTLLAADPSANVLYFTLGNQLAQQGRWAEAQQEYFKAFAANPDNADFAYNVAVSLDHLRQTKLALDYYRRAIALAEKGGASFDLAAARARAAQLGN